MTIILDTSVIIDVLRECQRRSELLAEWLDAGHDLACCAINITEVYAGMRAGEEEATQEFFEGIEYLEITPGAARRAGDLICESQRKGRTVGLPDAVIAAVALERDFALATDNRKDFAMSGLKLLTLPAGQ